MSTNTINGFIITAFRTKDFERLYDKFSFCPTKVIPCTFEHFEMTVVIFYNKDNKDSIEKLRQTVESLNPLKMTSFKPYMVSQQHIFDMLVDHFIKDFELNCGRMLNII